MVSNLGPSQKAYFAKNALNFDIFVFEPSFLNGRSYRSGTTSMRFSIKNYHIISYCYLKNSSGFENRIFNFFFEKFSCDFCIFVIFHHLLFGNRTSYEVKLIGFMFSVESCSRTRWYFRIGPPIPKLDPSRKRDLGKVERKFFKSHFLISFQNHRSYRFLSNITMISIVDYPFRMFIYFSSHPCVLG